MNAPVRRCGAVAAFALVATGLFCPGVVARPAAAYDPVGSGSTKLILAKPFAKHLAKDGVRIVTKGGARWRGRAIVLPASKGEVDPPLGVGTIESAGTLIFSKGRRQLPLRDLTFKAKRAPLYAKVGGGQLKLATAAGLRDRRSGFGTAFTADGLRLTAKFASRLAKKLDLRGSFHSRQLFGAIRAVAEPRTLHLREEGRLQLTIDQAFKQKLDNLFVSVNPIAPAELAPGPVLSFPISSESTLAPDATSGTVKLSGSLELLQLGSAQIFWRELWLQPESSALLAETDTEPAPPHPGRQPQSPLLGLQTGGAVTSDPFSRTIDLSGQPVALTAVAAASLNEAFAETRNVFGGGETIGAISVHVTAE